VTSTTQFDIAEVSKLPLALSVLRMVDRGQLKLSAKLGDLWPEAQELRDITVEQVLSHTAGFVQVIPKGVLKMEKLCNLDWMLNHIATTKVRALLPPGKMQQYHHFSYGWLLAGALNRSQQSIGAAWDNLTSGTSSSSGPIVANRAALRDGVDIAELTKRMSNASMEEMAMLFAKIERFLDARDRSEAPDATVQEKATGEVFKRMHGVVQMILPPAVSQPACESGFLPGALAFGTARSVADLVQRTAAGKVVSPATVQDMCRSRRPQGQGAVMLPDEYRNYQESEWGLGVELVEVPGRPKGAEKAWGHTSAGGSLALFVPGAKPLVVALLVNRTDAWQRGLSKDVLRAVAETAAKAS